MPTPVEIEIDEHEARVSEGLRLLKKRTGYDDPTDSRTPLSELLWIEDSPRCPHCKEPVELPAALEAWGIRRETIVHMFSFFLADGVHPAEVLSRVYAVGHHMGIAPFCDLTVRDKKLMLGDSHGAHHWRMKQIVDCLRRRPDAVIVKAPGQKSAAAAGRYSRAQQGNSNRKRKRKQRRHHGSNGA